MDPKLTAEMQAWLDTPAEHRDIQTGCRLIRQVLRKPVLALNLERRPRRFMPNAEYEMRKVMPMRLAGKTHDDVVRMMEQEKQIASVHQLGKPLPGTERMKTETRIQKTDEFRKGKRSDHESLPEDIQTCYTENLSIMQKMRALHERLVILSETHDKTVCPDNDRFPFVSEIIELDKRYHTNWEKYDSYGKE